MSSLPRVASPVHPILVHFTVALTSASLIFDAAGVLLHDATLGAAGWWTLAGSVVATVGTVASGVVSRLRLPMEEGEARRFLRAHMALGPILLGLLIVLCAWRAELWMAAAPVPWPYLAAATAIVALIAVQGFLGGELVYRWGAEVRGHYRRLPSTHADAGPAAPDDGSRAPSATSGEHRRMA